MLEVQGLPKFCQRPLVTKSLGPICIAISSVFVGNFQKPMVLHPAQCGSPKPANPKLIWKNIGHINLGEFLRFGRWSPATFTWPRPWFFTRPTVVQDVRPLRSLTWILTSRNLQRDVERWAAKVIQSVKFTWYLNIMCWKIPVESAPLWSRLDVLFISCLKPENSIYINYHLSNMESPSRLTCGHQRKVVLGMLGDILCKHKLPQPKRYCSTAWSVHNVLLPAEWRTLDSSSIEASIFRILQKLQAKNPWILFLFKIVKFSFQSHFPQFSIKKNPLLTNRRLKHSKHRPVSMYKSC